jgi:hypothetical protein
MSVATGLRAGRFPAPNQAIDITLEASRESAMQKILVRRLGLCTVMAACLCATMVPATAGGGLFTRGCAWRDLQILIMIEEREGASAGYTIQLSDAMLAMMHARIVCHAGSVVDALALYDRIAQSVTSIPRLSDQAN